MHKVGRYGCTIDPIRVLLEKGGEGRKEGRPLCLYNQVTMGQMAGLYCVCVDIVWIDVSDDSEASILDTTWFLRCCCFFFFLSLFPKHGRILDEPITLLVLLLNHGILGGKFKIYLSIHLSIYLSRLIGSTLDYAPLGRIEHKVASSEI